MAATFNDSYLMYMATALFSFCYVPTLYADFRNKNANLYNLPERIVLLCAMFLGITYAIRIQNMTLVIHYVPNICLETCTLLMKSYYASQNKRHITLALDTNAESSA